MYSYNYLFCKCCRSNFINIQKDFFLRFHVFEACPVSSLQVGVMGILDTQYIYFGGHFVWRTNKIRLKNLIDMKRGHF